jgi:DNA polymerase III subunit delta
MVYIFLDSDEYLAAQRIAQLRAALGDPEMADLNTVAVNGSKTDAGDILGHASMMPFLAPRRLVIVEGYLSHLDKRMAASENTDSAAYAEAVALFEGLPQVPETCDVVFVDGGVDKRRALWKGFRRSGGSGGETGKVAGLDSISKSVVVQFESLETPDSRTLPAWIVRRAQELEIAIDGQAIQLLADFVGPNLRQLDNELQKLAVYAAGRSIQAADVRLLVSDASEAMIWDLTDALSQRNAQRAMLALHALRRADANAFYLLTMIARQYRIILKVKDAMSGRGRANEQDIAKLVGERPYPVRKAMGQAGAYTVTGLEAILNRLLEADFAMKTGADPDTETDVLIAELTQRR